MQRVINGLIVVIFLAAAPAVHGSEAIALKDGDIPIRELPKRDRRSLWSLNLDNDILFPAGTDRDYTGGLSISREGSARPDYLISLSRPLAAIDSLLPGKPDFDVSELRKTTEAGLYGFTPRNIQTIKPVRDDRPYANLLYYSQSATRINWSGDATRESSLTLGILGLDVFEYLQDRAHRSTRTAKARGWGNQISDGGELTARYQLSRQQLLSSSPLGWELKSSRHISVGYITELGYGLSFRVGGFHSPWWSFKPDLATYAEQNGYFGRGSNYLIEQYFWGGISVKARAWNAFIQGQFKDSSHRLDFDQVNHLLLEAWLGYTQTMGSGYSLSYMVRMQSSEVKDGTGDRHLFWGGLRLSKAL